MQRKHIELLEKLITAKKERFVMDPPFDILIHSILNKITLNKLIKYYIIMEESDLKNSVLSNISKRLLTVRSPKKTYALFYSMLEGSPYIRRQRIRNILFTLLPFLGKLYYEDYFTTFYYSKYSNDKKSAISIYREIAHQKHHGTILLDYFNSQNQIYLRALIIDNAIEILVANIEDIWNTDPSSYLKRMLILLLCPKNSATLGFIELKDPHHFLFLKCSLQNVTTESLIRTYSEVPFAQKHFSLYNMSSKVSWEFMETEILKYVK